MATVLLLLFAPAPEVAFAFDDGDVRLMLTSAGKPVPVAIVKAYTGGEALHADGEIEEGVGRFPLPKRGACLVGITINGKECDLIPIHRHGDKVIPGRVSLTFGTRPCCRTVAVPREGQPTTTPEQIDGGVIALSIFGCACVVGALLLFLLPRSGGVR